MLDRLAKMWQRLTPEEIRLKAIEAKRRKPFWLAMFKSLGIGLLFGSAAVSLEIFAHKYWFGNNGGKSFRLPWYDLTEHYAEMALTFALVFVIFAGLNIYSHYFDSESGNDVTYICLGCQHTQANGAMCEICKGHKLLDFWFVKWVEPNEKSGDTPGRHD